MARIEIEKVSVRINFRVVSFLFLLCSIKMCLFCFDTRILVKPKLKSFTFLLSF